MIFFSYLSARDEDSENTTGSSSVLPPPHPDLPHPRLPYSVILIENVTLTVVNSIKENESEVAERRNP